MDSERNGNTLPSKKTGSEREQDRRSLTPAESETQFKAYLVQKLREQQDKNMLRQQQQQRQVEFLPNCFVFTHGMTSATCSAIAGPRDFSLGGGDPAEQVEEEDGDRDLGRDDKGPGEGREGEGRSRSRRSFAHGLKTDSLLFKVRDL